MPHAKSILGVDVSQGMVDLYNETGKKEGFSSMKAVCADLKGEDGELGGQKFNVIIVSIAPSERRGVQPNLTHVSNSVTWHTTISKTPER